MATPQWESLKTCIYGLSESELRAAGRAVAGFSYNPDKRLSSNASDFSRLVYQDAKARGGPITRNYSDLEARIRELSGHAASAPSTAPAPTPLAKCPPHLWLNSACVKCGEPRLEAKPDAERVADAIDNALTKDGRAALDADAIRAIVREELSNMPAKVIELRRDGALIAKLEARQHAMFPALLQAATSRMADGFAPNVWIQGPAGSGKTHAAKSLAGILGRAFEFNGALSLAHELLGYKDAAGVYHETAFRRAYVSPSVYLFDEIEGCLDNSPLLALNAALANGVASFPDSQVSRHPDSIILAGANTFGLGATADYVGRIKLDAAFLSRFPVKLTFDYDADLEAVICGNADWAREVQIARAKARAAGLKVLITPRDSMAGAALIAAGFSIEDAKRMTYLAALSPEQRGQVS